MKEATKDLAYFQQQAAEYYGFDTWSDFMIEKSNDHLALEVVMNKAAELYAAYKFEQGQAAERYAIQFNIGLNEYERVVLEKIQDPIEVSDLFLGFPNADSYESDLILNICCKLFNATFAK